MVGNRMFGGGDRHGVITDFQSPRICTAFSTLLLTLGIVAGIIVRGGPESFTWIYEHFKGLITATAVYSFIQTAVLYYLSFRGDKLLALGGNSDSHIYNVRYCANHFRHDANVNWITV